jgi:hypothetical protein
MTSSTTIMPVRGEGGEGKRDLGSHLHCSPTVARFRVLVVVKVAYLGSHPPRAPAAAAPLRCTPAAPP